VVDRRAVEEVRAQQQELADGRIRSVDDAELFDLNRAFHETIMSCSGNAFFADALCRVDTLRRLMEYRRTLPRDRALVRSREHVALADLVLAERLPEASAAMRRHLETVGEEKISGQAPRATQ
jgi:DNA-binding GntR family transcriptional regulator